MSDDRRSVSVRLTPDVAERLEKEAARRDVSVAFLAQRAIERALGAWESQELP